MITTLAALALGGAFLALSWDEDNIWKVFTCALVIVVAVNVMQFGSRIAGHEDGVCDVYAAMEDAGKLKPDHTPLEFCDD